MEKRTSKGFRKGERIGSPVRPRLLTLKEASAMLGLSLWSVRERVWRGDIPVVRFPGGRKMFIDTADLEQFIERNKTTIR
jgi:excisionase family DNA binding protein